MWKLGMKKVNDKFRNCIDTKHHILKCFYLLIVKYVFVYQGQKVHLFRPGLSFLAEAQPRLENRRGQKALDPFN
jgi:hypothetical protein